MGIIISRTESPLAGLVLEEREIFSRLPQPGSDIFIERLISTEFLARAEDIDGSTE
jgi:hypothetical protein